MFYIVCCGCHQIPINSKSLEAPPVSLWSVYMDGPFHPWPFMWF